MTDFGHIYVAVSGGYVSIPEEHWQYGIRFHCIFSGTAPDDVGTLQLNAVHAEEIDRTETDWTIVNTWSTSSGLEGFSPDDWLNDQVAPALTSHFGDNLWGDVRIDSVKASPIKTDGHVAEGRTALLTWTSAHPQGSGSSNPLPLENSAAISLRTPRIGRRGRGRIFYPVYGVNCVGSDGRLTSTRANATLAEVIAQLEGMSLTPSILTGAPWVLPIVTGSPWTDYGLVKTVKVGNVIDTQRSRRRSEPETYVSGSTSY